MLAIPALGRQKQDEDLNLGHGQHINAITNMTGR